MSTCEECAKSAAQCGRRLVCTPPPEDAVNKEHQGAEGQGAEGQGAEGQGAEGPASPGISECAPAALSLEGVLDGHEIGTRRADLDLVVDDVGTGRAAVVEAGEHGRGEGRHLGRALVPTAVRVVAAVGQVPVAVRGLPSVPNRRGSIETN
jgi:hypothetical protein